jgi:hypothetical protein
MNRKETTLALVAETEIHGFKFPESRNNSEWGKSLTKKMGRVRENPTNRLSLLSEQEVLSSPPDTTAGHTVIQMPGHEGEHFAIIDDYFTSPPYRGKKVLPLKAICLDLRLSLPRNLSVVRPLHSVWWARLRLLDASLLPWNPGQKITDTNPHVLADENHPIRRFYPTFWNGAFETDSDTIHYLHTTTIDVFCMKHRRIERTIIKTVLVAQWICGFYTPEQIVGLLFQNNTSIDTDDIQCFLQGSHGCLKPRLVSYEGIFCVRWEMTKDNADRRYY